MVVKSSFLNSCRCSQEAYIPVARRMMKMIIHVIMIQPWIIMRTIIKA